MSDLESTKIKVELDRLVASFKQEGRELSKKQLKKLTKKAKWNVHKPERKAREKEKRKRRKKEEKNLEQCLPRKKSKMMKDSTCKVRIVIDLSFADLMTDQEVSKTLKQVQRCYSSNRQSQEPVQLYLTSLAGRIQSELESKSGCMNWDVHYIEEHYAKAFEEKEVVYLTSESPNVLESLDETKVYVIGGLVDHNKQKGLTLRLAEEKLLGHARLPIDQLMDMKTRKVLSIYHVFEILLCVAQGSTWEDAFTQFLPKRKGATLKNGLIQAEDNENDDDGNESDGTGDASCDVASVDSDNKLDS